MECQRVYGYPDERCVEMRGDFDHVWNNQRCDKRLNVVCDVRDSGPSST